jgi:NAD(P)-dependent dehydrogenase (short-subunit alcohol dehydrogenase family)
MTDQLFDLSGSVAVVIGGTGVLGGALAEALATAGASVAIAGRNEERGNARCVAIRSCGGAAEYFEADASSRESLRLLKKKVTSKLGMARSFKRGWGRSACNVTQENPSRRFPPRVDFCDSTSLEAFCPVPGIGPAMCAAGKGIINIASVAGVRCRA